MDLMNKNCVPCQVGADPLTPELIKGYMSDISEEWQVIDNQKLERTFKFKDFKTALGFVNQVGQLAESEGHHPDIFLSWGQVIIQLMTHKINGLHDNDFILAAKIDHIRTNAKIEDNPALLQWWFDNPDK